MSPKDTAYIVERLAFRFMSMVADYERKLVEHRDAFGVRTSADAKIIEGMRADVEDLRNRLNALGIQAAKQAGVALGMIEGEGLVVAAQRVVKERDGLLTQVQDQRAEIERLQWENKTMQKDAEDGYVEAIKVLGDPIALSKERDALRAEVANLQARLRTTEIDAVKAQAPKRSHPVKAGEWVRRLTGFNTTPAGEVARVTLVDDDDPRQLEYEVVRPNGQKGRWSAKGCEPCDPPADHDTSAGKEAAEAAVMDSRSGDPMMCVGDEVEVIGRSTMHGSGTFPGKLAPIGTRGIATMIHGTAGFVELDNGTRSSICDVRKVPQ